MHEKVLGKDLAVNGAVTEEQMIMQVFGSGKNDDEVRAPKSLSTLDESYFELIRGTGREKTH